MLARHFTAVVQQCGGFRKGIGSHVTRMLSTTVPKYRILGQSPNAFLDKTILNRYRQLKYDKNKVQATYLWIDGTGEHIRLKDRVLDKIPTSVEALPTWQYDGSSTYQALGENSDTTLVPRAIYRDPFKAGENDIIVVCDTYKPDGNPTETNHRYLLQSAVDKTIDQEPWFGIEQEYTLLDMDERPFGWPENGFPAPQGPYCKFIDHIYANVLTFSLVLLYANRFVFNTRAVNSGFGMAVGKSFNRLLYIQNSYPHIYYLPRTQIAVSVQIAYTLEIWPRLMLSPVYMLALILVEQMQK